MGMYVNQEKYKNESSKNIDGHCSGFAGITKESMLLGQTNDFNLAEWLFGDMELVLHHVDSDNGLQSLFYTDPGYPINMGMNSEGLVLLWQTIDDGSRSNEYLGVPTQAAAREAMKYKTLEDAVDFLCSIPLVISNNFLLGQAKMDSTGKQELAFFDLEVGPPAGCTRMGTKSNGRERYVVHTNHILYDLEMLDRGDIYRKFSRKLPYNTVVRYNALHSRLKTVFKQSDFTVERMKNVYATPPSLQKNDTGATMVFEPMHLRMNIKFRGENWRVFEFATMKKSLQFIIKSSGSILLQFRTSILLLSMFLEKLKL